MAVFAMAPTGLLDSLLAAIQASLSVLLVIFYGGLAAYLSLLNPSTTRAISKVCVRMFLPALLLTKIGAELGRDHSSHDDDSAIGTSTGRGYVIVLIWAVVCHFLSFVIGVTAHLGLGLPDWTTAALMFNNTTSYPLLLVAALDETGILRVLVPGGEGGAEATQGAIERCKAYFLVFATISSCLTFAVGPRLIDSEHAADEDDEDKDLATLEEEDEDVTQVEGADGGQTASQPPQDPEAATETTGLLRPEARTSSTVRFVDPFAHNAFFPSARKPSSAIYTQPSSQGNGEGTPQRETSQSRISFSRFPSFDRRRASIVPRARWSRLGPRTKWWLLFISDFFNAPLLGALAGVVIGVSPPLHRAFFADTYDGGIFTAWLTASLKSIGGLFVPLPVVVAGVSLYTSMVETRRAAREDGPSGQYLPWGTVGFILVFRFVIWSVASISFIYLLASKTDLLGPDPMLWFALMLMPTGPPAMKLITLVQVSNADAEDEMNIAKLLTISYLISPILSFTVVGALRVSQACI